MTTRFRRTLDVAVLLVAAALAAPARAGGGPPHVVLIVVDTLRADRLGCYGSRRGLTPFLDALAARGVVFANAYAPSSWTNPSVASLLTSRYPSQHRVTRFTSVMPAEELTLAEILVPRGWAAGGFSANPALTHAAYGQGFQGWSVHPKNPKLAGGRLTKKTLAWADRARARAPGAPLLLYLQYMEPHSPYLPPPAYRQRFVRVPAPGTSAVDANRTMRTYPQALSDAQVRLLESLYDAEVAAADGVVRDFLGELEQRGLLENAVVVVTADHGEEFREHGRMQHGTSLFNEVLRVPLVVVAPGLAPRVVLENVSLLDVAPTLLELAGLPAEPRFEGRSLLPLARGAERQVDVVAQLPVKGPKVSERHSAALVRGTTKLLLERDGPTEERPVAYDLRADAGETAPDPPALAAELPGLVAELQTVQQALVLRAAPTAPTAPLDAETERKLRALGYIR